MSMVTYAGQEYAGRVEGRPGAPPGPVRTACPILREFFRVAEQEKRWTQKQMATALGVQTPALNKWRAGVSNPDIWKYREFAKLLGCELRLVW
jgi:DNA-binding XRE family transcriptional regulator